MPIDIWCHRSRAPFYPCFNKFEKGVYWFHLVHLSVRPSVEGIMSPLNLAGSVSYLPKGTKPLPEPISTCHSVGFCGTRINFTLCYVLQMKLSYPRDFDFWVNIVAADGLVLNGSVWHHKIVLDTDIWILSNMSYSIENCSFVNFYIIFHVKNSELCTFSLF